MTINDSIGIKLKQIRTDKHMTLKELSELTGLSIGFLSQIENGKASVAIDTLSKIAEFLEVTLPYFFSQHDTPKNSFIMRNHDISYHQNGPFSMKGNLTRNDDLSKIRPNLLALLPDSERPAQTSSHPGEEFLYVLDGVIMLELDGVQEVMYPCDSAHFKSTIPHTFWNISKHMAHVFSAHLHIPTEPQTETSKLN